jgi:hypothetical protein
VKRETIAGWGLVAVSALIYWFADRAFDAGRGDFFYLRRSQRPDVADVQPGRGRSSERPLLCPVRAVPAVALMPLVAVIGATNADHIEPG